MPEDLDPWLSARLAASELFVSAEQRVEDAVADLMTRWLAAVRRLVLGEDSQDAGGDHGAVVAAGPPDLGGFAASDPEWRAALQSIIAPVLEDLFDERFQATARVATISSLPYRQAYIESVFSRLVLFPSEQFEQIRPELEEAISEGEDIPNIRSRIEAILDFDSTVGARGEQAETRRLKARINEIETILDRGGVTQDEAAALRLERRRLYPQYYASQRRWQWKAQRIARTETSGALNGGSYYGAVAAAEILGEQRYKQWLATDDERTRTSHNLADGQVRSILVPFMVGGAPLRHPSDPLGPPHETIQCRCTALYLDAEELTDEQREQVDSAPADDGAKLADQSDTAGTVDALTTPVLEDVDDAGAGDLVEIEGPEGPVTVPAELAGERVPDDLEPYDFATLVAVYPRFATLDELGSLRILERLDALESAVDAAASAAGDAAVAAMVQAPDAAAAVEATVDAWGHLAEAWGADEEDAPAPPWAAGIEPDPIGEGPGFRYDTDLDQTIEDPDVPAGWVLYEDPYTGDRSYYEAAGIGKQQSRAQRLAAARESYADWVHQQFLDAENVTRGNLFSAKGKQAGVSERALWSSNAVSARAWASEELLRYWQDHPRLTQVEWLYAETGDDRYRLAAQRAKENNAKVLSAFSLVADPRTRAAVTAAAGRAGYSRAELAGAWVAGLTAGRAGTEVTACPYRPRADGLLALVWARAWRSTSPETIIASGEVTTMADLPNGWRGVLAALDVPTGDGRMLATPEGGVKLRTKPLSLLWQERLAPGHDGAVVAGRVDRAWMSTTDAGTTVVMGEGPLDLGGEHGAEAARLLGEGYFNGASLDPDEVEFREVFVNEAGQQVDVDDMEFEEFYELFDTGELKPLMIMTNWRVMSATLTPQSAFNETRIEPLFDYVPAGDQAGDLESVVAAAGEVMVAADDELVGRLIRPAPAEHYDDPKLDKPTPLTVTDDGRVYGHIARWGECHIGIGNACVTAPHSVTSYAHFHLGEVATTKGRIAAGKLTIGGGHADERLGYRAAMEHYDNVATAVAAVRAGEDAFGIWVAGRVLSGVDADTLERFMLCPPSGDWRRIGGNLELVAACSVNTAGFPVPRTVAASAGGHQISLIAAGARPLARLRRMRDRKRGAVDVDQLAVKVARHVRAYASNDARAEQLARRIGRDTTTRASRAMARLESHRGD